MSISLNQGSLNQVSGVLVIYICNKCQLQSCIMSRWLIASLVLMIPIVSLLYTCFVVTQEMDIRYLQIEETMDTNSNGQPFQVVGAWHRIMLFISILFVL